VINFRFHLISLVAVFLALGVGVAAGASFVDRATVESLQGRVEDLDGAFRERGVELGLTQEQLAESDRSAAALAGERSFALEGQLIGQPVVLVVSDGVPAELLSALRTSLASAGVDDPVLVRLLPAIDLNDSATLDRLVASIPLRSDQPDPPALRTALVELLALALAELSGPPPEVPVPVDDPATPATTSEFSELDSLRAVDRSSALSVLGRLEELGLISVEAASGITSEAFNGDSGVRYVEVISSTDDVDSELVMVPLAEAMAAAAPATLTVAEASGTRPVGGIVTTTTSPGVAVSEPLTQLRSSPSVERLSTVDGVDDPFGRIAVVYSVALQRRVGGVGAFGTGPGSVGPFPSVPAS